MKITVLKVCFIITQVASNASGYPFASLSSILLVGDLPQTPGQIHFVFS